jgi:hypothetical protein
MKLCTLHSTKFRVELYDRSENVNVKVRGILLVENGLNFV